MSVQAENDGKNLRRLRGRMARSRSIGTKLTPDEERQVGFHQHGAAYQPMGMVQIPLGKDRSPPAGTYSFFLHEAGITSPCTQAGPVVWRVMALGVSQNANEEKLHCAVR
jgi:hypothetical protein